MSKLMKLIDQFIGGARGWWYYDFRIGDRHFSGGMFYLLPSSNNSSMLCLKPFKSLIFCSNSVVSIPSFFAIFMASLFISMPVTAP